MPRHSSHGPGCGIGHGPANGHGWGGPARGAGTGGAARPYSSSHQPSRECRRGRSPAERAERRTARQAKAAALEEVLYDLALHAAREETQVQAAYRLHAIYAGKPVASVKPSAIAGVTRKV